MKKDTVAAVANTVRALSIDMIQKASSGHPGLPMGAAEIGALLFGKIMNYNPQDPKWINRDRFVLSAGHGSAMLYSLLHLSGFDLSLDDLKNFRQIDSKTPGHPEYEHTAGVDTTTGPLGAGFSNAVGFAIAERMLAAKFNTENTKIIDHFTYVFCGDGDIMEGITSEAASIAGHLELGKLIVLYDDNDITIEGKVSLTFSDNVEERFKAYGWQVLKSDGYDTEGILKCVEEAKKDACNACNAGKPTLIILKTVIGKGSPNLAGTNKVHGAPLGADEVRATKKNLGIPEDADFYISPEAKSFFEERQKELKKVYDKWQDDFKSLSSDNNFATLWDEYMKTGGIKIDESALPEFKVGESIATRVAGGNTLVKLCAAIPNFVGGSADLAPSNNTVVPDNGDFTKANRSGRTIRFGIREHAMGGIANGIMLHGGLRSYCATFLVFSDYMKPPIRLAALMNIPTTFIFTHDSIYVGEDGPTHQPIEHAEALRIIPNVRVIRPGDAQETVVAWQMAMERENGPVALILTRQNLKVYEKQDKDWKNNMRKGAYIVKDAEGAPEVVVLASGSEVNLALEALAFTNKKVRVVSVPSRELFEKQAKEFRSSLIPEGVRLVTAECGVSGGWRGFAKDEKDMLAINEFGTSGNSKDVAKKYGFTPENLAAIINKG
ncbi:MAG: transketolase [Spirochaetes bacterium]|nr:transketolase [Spirochaetota bacterium]